MKIKSKLNDVYFEPWQTPVISAENLWCHGVLHTNWYTHFCVSINAEKDIHVISIDHRSPYRIVDEDHQSYLEKYFASDLSPEERKLHIPKLCRTWKIWGTTFIHEMDEGRFLSGLGKEHDKEIFQYLMFTQDEWIEFISDPPRWETFKDSDIKTVMNHYLDVDCDQFWKSAEDRKQENCSKS